MAAVDYFLKLDGVPGESEDAKHKGEMQISSFSFGASNGGSSVQGTGAGAGKVSMQDFHFTIQNGISSPKLFEMVSTGEHIPKGVLTCRKAGGDGREYLIITFEKILVSSFQTGGGGGDVLPMDQCSFNFTKIEQVYKPQDDKGGLGGNIRFAYDLKQNKKV